MRKPTSPSVSMAKKLVSIIGAVVLVAALTDCAATPPKPKTSLWEVTSPQRVVYIASDPQILSASDYPLPEPFLQAFAESSELYVEHIPTPDKETQAKIQAIVKQHGVLPEHRTLKDFLTKDQLRAVQTAVKNAGIPFSRAKHIPPWRLAMALGGASPAQSPGITPKEQLTYQLSLKAHDRNMRIIPFESYTKLFEIVYSLPKQAQVGWLMLAIKPSSEHGSLNNQHLRVQKLVAPPQNLWVKRGK